MPGVFTAMPTARNEARTGMDARRPAGPARPVPTRTPRTLPLTLPLPLTGGGHGRGWYALPLARAMGAHRG